MADLNDELAFATITELNARLRSKQISAVDLAKGFCQRLESLGPKYNALALLLRDDAVRKAKDVDKELKRGRTRGPLQGIPFAAKDLLSFAKRPTTWGAKPFEDQEFDTTATTLTRLNRAGSVLCGKLAMVELAGGGGYRYAAASLTGPGLNPWDATRWAGGSSSGSGAAVAAGMVPFALGSETNGSIITPAAFCGVTALRPTYGLVSRAGAMPLAWTMDKIGPFARSVEDCGIILSAIAGGDSLDPASAGKGFHFNPKFAPAMANLRVGVAESDIESCDEPLRPAFLDAFAVLQGIGVQIKAAALPDAPYGTLSSIIISSEGSTVFRELIESGKVDELADARQIAGLKAGLDIKACDYLHAMRIRRDVQTGIAKIFADVDVLVSPARFNVANAAAEPLDRPSGATPARSGAGLRALTTAGNLAGLPALVLPCGFSGGLPVAIQLVGRPFSENTLLALGLEFQKRTDWHRKRPRL